MAMGWNEGAADYTAAGITGGLGLGGAALSAIPGVGPVAGAIVGGIGALAGGIINLTKKPPALPGPTGAQLVNLERANTLAERTAELQGLSPAEMANYDELATRSSVRQASIANAYNSVYQMSPLEQESLVKSIVTQQQEESARQRKEFMNMDAEAIRRSVSMKLAANDEAARRANEIAEIERANEISRLNMMSQKYQMLGEVIGDAGGMITEAIRYSDERKKRLQQDQVKQLETTGYLGKEKVSSGVTEPSARDIVPDIIIDAGVDNNLPVDNAIMAATGIQTSQDYGWRPSQPRPSVTSAGTSEWERYFEQNYMRDYASGRGGYVRRSTIPQVAGL